MLSFCLHWFYFKSLFFRLICFNKHFQWILFGQSLHQVIRINNYCFFFWHYYSWPKFTWLLLYSSIIERRRWKKKKSRRMHSEINNGYSFSLWIHVRLIVKAINSRGRSWYLGYVHDSNTCSSVSIISQLYDNFVI